MEILDQKNIVITDKFQPGCDVKVGQTFKLSQSGTLYAIEIGLRYPTGKYKIWIEDSNGTILDTSTFDGILNVSQKISFSGNILLEKNVQYKFFIELIGKKTPIIVYASNGNTYTNGSLIYCNEGKWLEIDTMDLYFKIFLKI